MQEKSIMHTRTSSKREQEASNEFQTTNKRVSYVGT